MWALVQSGPVPDPGPWRRVWTVPLQSQKTSNGGIASCVSIYIYIYSEVLAAPTRLARGEISGDGPIGRC